MLDLAPHSFYVLPGLFLPLHFILFISGAELGAELNFECNDRRNKIIPKEVQAKHPRASSVTNT